MNDMNNFIVSLKKYILLRKALSIKETCEIVLQKIAFIRTRLMRKKQTLLIFFFYSRKIALNIY